MARENAIPEPVKIAIIRALACFDSLSTVAASIKQEYGLVVSPQAIEAHDPTKRAGGKLAEKWRLLFDETRKTFIEDTAAIPIAHRSTRLRALQRMAERAEKVGNLGLAASLHKQAAEEMGNAYTNRRELTGRDGKDLPAVVPATVIVLPDNGRG
jgi:hypothetical protein